MKDDTTDFGYTKVNTAEKERLVGRVFDSVAPRYDLMNDLMSFGIHRLWKAHALALTQFRPTHCVLDLAAGTGDLALTIAPKVPQGHVTLCDINANMLLEAKKRLLNKGIVENVSTVQANAEALPFHANQFDRVTMAFGLRNVTFKERALKSLYHVLKPGGRLTILEFSHPPSKTLSSVYDTYSFHVLPKIGEWVASDRESYQYLAESIRMHPNQDTLKTMILDAGFDACTYQNLTGGIVAIHQGMKY